MTVSATGWTDPGAYQVAPGVHRIPLPLNLHGLRAVNVYAIEDGDGLTLIDAGWYRAESLAELSRQLGSFGSGLPDVRSILVTHMHGDHYTQAMPIRRDHGARVGLGAGEKSNLDVLMQDRTGTRREPETTRLVLAGATELLEQFARSMGDEGVRDIFEWPDLWLDDEADLPLTGRSLRVVSTPGHTRGHVVFHDRDGGLLFAGDHVLPHITPSIGYEPSPVASPLADFLESLARVRRLPDAVLLPAHGPVTGSVHARVDQLIDHHEQRFAAIAAVLATGRYTAATVAPGLKWTRHSRDLDELDLFNRYLAIAETLAHLEVMSARGWVQRAVQADGSLNFTP